MGRGKSNYWSVLYLKRLWVWEDENASLTDLEQLLSAAEVPVQMQEKRVLALSVCLIVAAKIEWGNTVKKHGRFQTTL